MNWCIEPSAEVHGFEQEHIENAPKSRRGKEDI